MEILLKTQTEQLIPMNVDPHDLIDVVKKKIEEKVGTPVETQRLIYDGRQLEGLRTVKDYKIAADSVVLLNDRMSGVV